MTRIAWLFGGLALAGCLDPGQPGNLVPRTVDEDPTLPRIEVQGALLHAEAFGDPAAPTVMVLHGGPGNDYRGLLPLKALADDGYRVVFWDQRGAGLSQRFDADHYSYALYLEDLRLVIEQMASPGQPLVFIGHSWGAMYATWFINHHGDYGGRLRGAILSEPGAFNTRQLDQFIDRLFGSVSVTDERLNDVTWSAQFLSRDDHARADYLAALFAMRGAPSEHKDQNNLSPLWRIGSVVSSALIGLAEKEGMDWTTNLKQFGHKVLFLRGDRNTALTLVHQQELAASYASADIVTIPNVGHEMIWERPAEYLAHTRDYFRAIGFHGVRR